MNKLRVHLWTLPRFFAFPAAACAIALGCIQTSSSGLLIALAILASGTVMAWGHSMNTYLDFKTGIDRIGDKTSRPKTYTAGNQVIVQGIMHPDEVLINALFWLGLSLIFIMAVAANSTFWVFLPWALSALMTFLYSWGKLHYACELALGLGFGPLAVMMGAAASESFTFSDFGPAFMAGLLFGWVFGFGAEFIDQAFDADQNWDSGLRNMGALAWKTGIHPATFTGLLLAFAYLIQIALVIGGFLAPLTLSSFSVVPVFLILIMAICKDKPDIKQAELRFDDKVIWATMGVMFLWMLSIVISQAVAT